MKNDKKKNTNKNENQSKPNSGIENFIVEKHSQNRVLKKIIQELERKSLKSDS